MPDAVPLNRGSVANQAIANGANFDEDIYSCGNDVLTVDVDMTGGVVGDLTVSVFPFESDNVTVMPILILPTAAVGPTLSAGHIYYHAQYNIQATEKVRLRMTNGNAAPQTITRRSWRTGD